MWPLSWRSVFPQMFDASGARCLGAAGGVNVDGLAVEIEAALGEDVRPDLLEGARRRSRGRWNMI